MVEYKQSDAYHQRVAASQPKQQERRNVQTLANPDDPVAWARHLREEFMSAHKYANNVWVFSIPPQETMNRYRTGELLEEANAATRRSGYGAIRDSEGRIVELLRPLAFEDDNW